MLLRCTLLWTVLALVAACGDDESGTQPVVDAGTDTRTRPDLEQQDQGEPGEDVPESDVLDVVADEPDVPEEPDIADEPEITDIADTSDVTDATPDVPDAVDTGPDIIVPTDDCDPLGIPERWVGTFDGEITSNIPDIGSYTFQGPVNGEVRFEIWCINEKLVVLGELDGGSTNCALATGCPFTARLDGLYDPETQHMQGQILEAVIDYTMVQVYAEGEFEGDLSDGPMLSGVWSGEKTGISSASLSWVEASGAGTWEAVPEP